LGLVKTETSSVPDRKRKKEPKDLGGVVLNMKLYPFFTASLIPPPVRKEK